MCGVVGAIGAAAVTSYMTYQSEKAQGKADLAVAKYNARLQENAAIQTRNKGIEEENKKRLETSMLAERQRTQLAANGVDVGSGTAQSLVSDTFLRGDLDAMRIRENYTDQAKAQDDQSSLTLLQGRNARKLARMRGVYGGISSGMQSGASVYGAGNGGWVGKGW